MAESNMPNTLPPWSAGRVIGSTIVVLLVCAGFYALYRFSTIFFVLFVAIVLATALRPAVGWLERWHIPQWLGILLIYFTFVIAVVGLGALLAPLIITQGAELIDNAPEYYTNIRGTLSQYQNPITREIVNRLPPEIPLNAQVPVGGTGQLETIGQVVNVLRSFTWGIVGLIALVVITYFWILDREQILRAGVLLFPTDRRDSARALWDTLEEKVGAFVRGQALLSLSIGLLSLVAFLVIGVPNAVLLALLAGIFEAIPYIGPLLTAVLAIVLTLAEAPEKIVWVIIASAVIQQTENSLLVPRIMGRTVGVNAVVTLLAIAAFGALLGVAGAIMAIPLAVVLQVLFQRLITSTQEGPVTVMAGRDRYAVLRYEAQNLASDLRNRIRNLPDRADRTGLEEDLEELVMEVDQLLLAASTPGPEGAEAIQNRPQQGAR